jgi:7,8-dihydropterin-6-yl-methyl-4-(beta-D-ribofuranosyl)aminobenzene 5'-phosphate synthase
MAHPAEALRPVDTLEVRVLVDNLTDNLSSIPENVSHEIQTLTALGMRAWGGECMCCAHHGLSLVVTVQIDDERRSFLFDAGPEGYTVERTAKSWGSSLVTSMQPCSRTGIGIMAAA